MEGEAHPTYLGLLAKFLDFCDTLKFDFLDYDFESPINSMKLDLKFLMMLLWGLISWEQSESNWHLRFIINTLMYKLGITVKEFSMDVSIVLRKRQIMNWEELSYDFEKTMQQFKLQAKEICILSLDGAFKCESCQHNQELFLNNIEKTACFIDIIRYNIKALLNSNNIYLIAPVKKQIAIIQRRLEEFPRFISPINRPITNLKILRKVISRTQTWANHISCLACLYWTNGMDENLASAMDGMFNDLMTHKFMPYSTSGVVASYLEDTMIPQLVASYFDSLFEDFLAIPVNDDGEILRDGLIYLLSFVVDPPLLEEDLEDKRELILAQIYAIINELPYLLCSTRLDEIPGFLQKINRVKAGVGELYSMNSHSLKLNSPKTNPIGSLDLLLSTLKKMSDAKVSFIPSIRHQAVILQNELALLMQFLRSNIGLQNERGELKDLWTEIVNIVYYATYVTNLCSAKRFYVWYGITGLANVIEDIKRIKTEIQKIEVEKMSNKTKIAPEIESSDGTPPRATTSKIEGVILGFEEIAEVIIDNLTRGQKSLTIISISGLPGQGKTTLAKKIYNDCRVELHFHKTAWCYVSKDFATRKLLMKIIHDLEKPNDSNDNAKQLETQDLAELLRKSLKGKRYLIVMDDIWDVNAWHKIKGSFPDDNNGSRILFTSRNRDLASISHHLKPFSDDISWELMKNKVFTGDGCPQEFLEVGKQIAHYCKGLPLAVVLIAYVLGRIEQKLDLWNKVAENLKAHLASEGCMNIIELSYNYLPDYLKPCFLYFGSFPRGEYILAKTLKLLWIAEGFIQDSEIKSSNDLADNYLNHLVSQNLVVVADISSTGGIKRCGIHDLLYDLCLGKAKEENFLDWTEKSIFVDGCHSGPQKYIHHRLCIRETDPFVESRPICSRKELPSSQVQSLLWFNYFARRSTLEDVPYFLESFKGVLVLNLEAVDFFAFPEAVLSMIQLRFLVVWGGFESIPSSIANLCNLETLNIMPSGEILLPNSLWKITSLRYVKIVHGNLNLEDCEENNPSFEANNIERLGNLRLVRDRKKMEEIVRKLSKLGRLRKLTCYFRTEDYHSSFFSMFSCLKNLESLVFERHDHHPPPPNGETSSLLFEEFDLSRLVFPENLKKLSLMELQLPWSAISTIGKQLPNLEVLKLCREACVGACWDLEDGDFSRLKHLQLSKLGIEQINVSDCDDTPFPCLERLDVRECKNLKEIPSCFGNICTLNLIKWWLCPVVPLSSIKSIFDTQRELENHDLQVSVVFSPDE